MIFNIYKADNNHNGITVDYPDDLFRPIKEFKLTANKHLGDKVSEWTTLAEKANLISSTRLKQVQKTLSLVSGIYADKSHSYPLGLQKAVMVNVIAFSGTEGYNSRYIKLLLNWFCFATHYGYQPVTYLLPTGDKNFSASVKELRKLGIHSHFVTYPEELFWKLCLNKTTPLLPATHHRASYDGNVISFKTFGALVMLVPSLEALLLGYDVIYFDLDISLVTDPLPAIAIGNADLKVSFEQRTCVFPTQWAPQINWEDMEPNTGVFLVRSSSGGKLLFKTFLQKVVDESYVNDQKGLTQALQALAAEVTFDCNPLLPNMTASDIIHREAPRHRNSGIRYCFLNEFVFQNGKMGLHCAKGKGGSFSEYAIGMHKQGQLTAGQWDANQTTPAVILPALIHANFCDDKIEEFKNLGLWLLEPPPAFLPSPLTVATEAAAGEEDISYEPPSVCRPYDPAYTAMAKVDWATVLQNANHDVNTALA